ncbi:MAG: hypothetical protein HUJ76_08645, partial [Parasporobacterium sp.]|nr:hypothetical protein [Parasporobacterium sp.]
VAIMVNNNEAVARVTGNVGNANNKAAAVDVTAQTNINVTGEYTDDVSVQAIAGAGKGNGSDAIVAAGALALLYSNAKTAAQIGGTKEIIIYAADSAQVNVSAKEKNKSAVRAWGASVSNALFKEQNGEGGAAAGNQVGANPQGNPAADTKGRGFGAAFAVLRANNETTSAIGDNVSIYGKGLNLTAEKEKVTTDDYRYNGVNLNGKITLGTSPTFIIPVNTTNEPDSPRDLYMVDIFENGLSLLNILASHDYYVEAAGGSIASNSSLSLAGSFAMLLITDITKAEMGNNVVLHMQDGGAKAAAKADSVIAAIAGSVAYGNEKTAGASVIYTKDISQVKATAGDSLRIYTTGDVTFDADSDAYELIITAAAAVSNAAEAQAAGSPFAGEGVLNIYYSEKDVEASAGTDVLIGSLVDAAGDVLFNADHNFTQTAVTGGGSVSKGGIGVGVSAGFIILKENVLAFLDEGSSVFADSLTINADQYTKLTEIIANGAVTTAGSTAVGVSPVLLYVNNTTGAYLETNKDNKDKSSDYTAIIELDKDLKVTANDETKFIVVSGAVAVSTVDKSVGGDVQIDIVKKHVDAIIGSGTSEGSHLDAKVKGNTDVRADAKETAYSIAVGLAGSTQPSATGSVLVLYNSNEITSRIGDYVYINLLKEGGDINVYAHDNIYQLSVAGELGFSNRAWAAGLANVDTILNGTVKAEVGKMAYLKGNNITVSAESENTLYQIAIAGNASFTNAFNGSAVGTNIGQTTKAVVYEGRGGDKLTLDAANDISILANNVSRIVNAAGSLGISTSAAAGGAVDVALFRSTTLAQLSKGANVKAGGNVSVIATASEDFRDVCVGAEVAAGTGLGEASACLVVVSRENVTESVIGGIVDKKDRKTAEDYQSDASDTSVKAGGSVKVYAENDSSSFALAGNAGLTSGSYGFAAGVVVVTNDSLTWAEIGKNAVVSANGNRPVSAALGGLVITPVSAVLETGTSYEYKKSKRETKNYNGVLVGSYMNSILNIIALAGGGSKDISFMPASATLDDNAITIARINTAARVNQGNREAGSRASVHVCSAGDTTDSVSDGSAGIAGTAGVTGVVTVYIGSKETVAEALSSEVYAEGDIEISALSDSNVFVTGAGASGGGTAGLGAAATVVTFNDTAKAKASGTFKSKGSINVLSDLNGNLEALTISIQGGGTAGVGFTVAVAVYTGKSIAEVGASSDFDAKGDINVIAQSNGKIDTAAAGAAGAGAGSFEGAVSVDVINITTQAIIDDSAAGAKGSFKASGDILVKALDNSELQSLLGAATAAGTAAVGAAVQASVYRSQVSAVIGAYNDVTGGSVTLLAGNNRKVNAHSVMVSGAGIAGVVGSINVVSVGGSVGSDEADKTKDSTQTDSATKDAAKAASDVGQNCVTSALNKDFSSVNSNNKTVKALNDRFAGLKDRTSSLVSSYFAESVDMKNKTAAITGIGGIIKSTSGNVTVEASETSTVNAVAGQAGGAGVTVGVSVNCITLKGTTEAKVLSDITSAKDINIKAENNVNLGRLISFGGNAGLYAAACGAVLYTDISGSNSAAAEGTITSLNNGRLSVTADQNVHQTEDGSYLAVAPAVAVGGAVGAPVAILYAKASNTASSEGTVKKLSEVNITADTDMQLNPQTVGVTVGLGGGLGVAVVKADVTVDNTAYISGNASADGDVNVTAERRINLKTDVSAVAGGTAAGAEGSVAKLFINGKSSAYIKDAKVTADTVRVIARDFIHGEIQASGVSVAAGLAVGITTAKIVVGTETESFLDGADITADDLYVLALFNRNDDGSDAVFKADGKDKKYGFVISGTSSGGSGVAGGSGLYVTAEINPSVKVYTSGTSGKNALLDIKNTAVFKALRGIVLDVDYEC